MQMEGKIHDYKFQDTSEKRKIKRKQELQTLRAFMKLAEDKVGEKRQTLGQVTGISKPRECELRNFGEKPFTPPPYILVNEPLAHVNQLYPQLPEMQNPVVEFKGGFTGQADISVEVEQRLEAAVDDINTAVNLMARRMEQLEAGRSTEIALVDVGEVREQSLTQHSSGITAKDAIHGGVENVNAEEEVEPERSHTPSSTGSLTGTGKRK